MSESTSRLATMTEVRKFFDINPLKTFKEMWDELADKDRWHIRSGLGDGTFDYDPKSEPPPSYGRK